MKRNLLYIKSTWWVHQKKENSARNSHKNQKNLTVYLIHKTSITIRLNLSEKITHHCHYNRNYLSGILLPFSFRFSLFSRAAAASWRPWRRAAIVLAWNSRVNFQKSGRILPIRTLQHELLVAWWPSTMQNHCFLPPHGRSFGCVLNAGSFV